MIALNKDGAGLVLLAVERPPVIPGIVCRSMTRSPLRAQS